MTPKVGLWFMLAPGSFKSGVLVAPVASMRTSSLTCSRRENDLNSNRLSERVPGARSSSRAGGSGVIVY